MAWEKVFLVLALLSSACFSKSIDTSDSGDEVMQNPDLFEGDIIGISPGDERNAVVEKHRIWPNGRIPYTIDPKLKPQESQIKEAMQHYADKTCIKFVPRTDEGNYVRIFPGRGWGNELDS
ncbi:metalloendopeptidase [Nephila pilipes]|uniref:Metalloendopeptidase n=1 Tax=Nephila pilipes TaxID=299642 RepID=A0A8X6MET9_NEPPI|nr:metalloendopeptidase [Nephila pilipes]